MTTKMECRRGDEDTRVDPAEFLSEECMLLVLSFLQPSKRSPLCACCGLLYRRSLDEATEEEDTGAGGENEDAATGAVDDIDEGGEAQHDLVVANDLVAVGSDDEEEGAATNGAASGTTSTDKDGGEDDDDEEGDDIVAHSVDAFDAMDFHRSMAGVSRHWKSLMDSSAKRFAPLVRFDPARVRGRHRSGESVIEWIGRHELAMQSFFCEGERTPALLAALKKCDMSKLVGFETNASISDLLAKVSPTKAFMDDLVQECLPDPTSLIFNFGLILDSEARLPTSLELPLFSHVSITTLVLELQIDGPNDMLYSEILSPFIKDLPSLVELVLISDSNSSGDNNEAIHIASKSLLRLKVDCFWPCEGVAHLSLACPSLELFQCRGMIGFFPPGMVIGVEQAVVRAEGVPESCIGAVLIGPGQVSAEGRGTPTGKLHFPFEVLVGLANHV